MKEKKLKVIAVIPARYGSTRLPGKPLVDICGKPMIQHVHEKVKRAKFIDEVIVATDDVRIMEAVLSFGGTCIMTDKNHQSGTDRLVEIMSQKGADIYINVQGDEPLIRPEVISLLAEHMIENQNVDVTTLCHNITTEESINPNTVKVVLSHYKQALYFSRSPIPYPREDSKAKYYKHIGIYAYRHKVLADYANLPASMLEETELLEQLRLLEAGIGINALIVEPTHQGVDTQECLENVREIMSSK